MLSTRSFAIIVGLFNLQQQSNKQNGPEILEAKAAHIEDETKFLVDLME
jgi:hypothetical protein